MRTSREELPNHGSPTIMRQDHGKPECVESLDFRDDERMQVSSRASALSTRCCIADC